ncbi:MAG: hypothetical protein E6J90_51555 [Deltaproteobacteria bacterium]|nr:MAG: hypothetical protein E6J90_51555 [Deltaproteobacteria bacterium]
MLARTGLLAEAAGRTPIAARAIARSATSSGGGGARCAASSRRSLPILAASPRRDGCPSRRPPARLAEPERGTIPEVTSQLSRLGDGTLLAHSSRTQVPEWPALRVMRVMRVIVPIPRVSVADPAVRVMRVMRVMRVILPVAAEAGGFSGAGDAGDAGDEGG